MPNVYSKQPWDESDGLHHWDPVLHLGQLFDSHITPFPLHLWLNSNRGLCVLAVYCSSRCQVKAEWEKQNCCSWHGNKIVRGQRPDGNLVLIFLRHSVTWWEFFFFSLPQNNIQQVFRRLHAFLVEEYSGEDLQIIACPSTEQVQLTGNWHILITLQQPSKNTAEMSAGQTQPDLTSFVHLFQINLLLSVTK